MRVKPDVVQPDFVKGWYLCQLEVLECKKVPWPDALTEKKYSIEDCGWPGKDFAYECKIDLLTGRTHQVCILFPSIVKGELEQGRGFLTHALSPLFIYR